MITFNKGTPPKPDWYITKEPGQPSDPSKFNGLRWWTGEVWGPWFHASHTAEQVGFHFERARLPKPTTRYPWAPVTSASAPQFLFMTDTKELIKLITPETKPSFSPNLHKFVKKWAMENPAYWVPQVWVDERGTLWIGRMDLGIKPDAPCGFIGLRLMSALCVGAKAINDRGWHMGMGPGNMTHVADFWGRYLQIGRCAIDTKHTQFFIGDQGRYIMANKIRTCTWCGAQHKQHIEKKTTVKLIERYTPLPCEAPKKASHA